MRVFKRIFLGAAIVFVAIQFVRPAKNLATGPQPNDALVCYPASAEVKQLLTVACYDCHSNNTRYPWYAEVQPVGWWLSQHVLDAKHSFNFSELAAYSPKTAGRRLDACIDEITDHTMPLSSYRITHKDARLTEAQIKVLSDWFEETRDLIAEQAAAKPAAK